MSYKKLELKERANILKKTCFLRHRQAKLLHFLIKQYILSGRNSDQGLQWKEEQKEQFNQEKENKDKAADESYTSAFEDEDESVPKPPKEKELNEGNKKKKKDMDPLLSMLNDWTSVRQ